MLIHQVDIGLLAVVARERKNIERLFLKKIIVLDGLCQIKLYHLFRKELNLPDDKVAAFVSAVEEVVVQEFRNEKQAISTKEDIQNLKDSIHRLELKIEQSKGNIYKALFVSGIVQLLAILSGVLAIAKYIQ
ncbi:MAG: hypothetical protein M3040_05805 [Bacteroidota bacterium]|nr:hypothetical protein [Bacteroidota bacterium]